MSIPLSDASSESLSPAPGGYAARAAARALPARQRVGPWAVACSSGRKLITLWAALARVRCFEEANFERYQERRLRRLLRRAAAVPLYRELWEKAGVGPRDFRSLPDLARFPIVEKDEVRDRWPEGCLLPGTALDRCRVQQTSGSSGQCMEIALSLRCDDARNVYSQRVYGWHGFRWFRRAAYLFPYRLPFRNNLGLYRNQYIDANQAPSRIRGKLEELRPVVLAATPSDVFDLLDGLGERPDLRGIGLRALCLHSEPISEDERQHLEQVFGCPVRINYYCNEVWAIAAECEHGSLHQFMDNVVLELVDEDDQPVPDGEPGQVVVTSLNNFVQPFIRYRLGDVAVRRRERGCACGRELPILERLEGRQDDVFVHPDGRRIHPSKITVAVKSPCFDYPGRQIFRDYQVVQDRWDHVVVRLVPGRDRELFDGCARRAAGNLRRLLEPGVAVQLEVRERLEAGRGGKRKIFARELADARDGGGSR